MLSITLRQLEYATAVARHGGMTAAAEALHVSQPALSVAIGQLESLLECKLFVRRAGGRLTPTSFGRGWLEQADASLLGLQRLTMRSSTPEEIRLAIFQDLAPACLAPLLAKALQLTPRIKIVPQILDFENIMEHLRNGKSDLALTWDLGLEADIARQTLARVQPHVVVPPDHPLAQTPTTCLQAVAALPLVLADQGLSIGHMRALFSRQNLVPQISHRTASLDIMRSYAANGLGVGISYTKPAVNLSHDGKPLTTRPISDAGAEPLILAHLAQSQRSGAALQLAALITSVLPQTLCGESLP